MASFGDLVWGSDGWGGINDAPPVLIVLPTTFIARFIATDLLAVEFPTFVRVDSYFKDITNYVITVLDNTPIPGDAVKVLAVLLPPTDEAPVATDTVYLQTTPHTIGAYYSVSFSILYDPDGVLVILDAPIKYQSRVTKSMLEMKSLPSHFDGRVTSLVRNIVTAISLSDDTIGGSEGNNL